MNALFLSLLFLLTSTAFAQDLFIIKKNINPKNVLHYKADVVQCKLKSVTPYWVMGEVDGRIEDLTTHEKTYFEPKISYNNGTEVDFSMGALDKMGSKLSDKIVKVRLENCKPRAILEIRDQETQITEISVVVNMLMVVKSMTITGLDSVGSRVAIKIEN